MDKIYLEYLDVSTSILDVLTTLGDDLPSFLGCLCAIGGTVSSLALWNGWLQTLCKACSTILRVIISEEPWTDAIDGNMQAVATGSM